MNRLLEIGFVPVGHWIMRDDRLRLELMRHATQRNILYAFVCDGEVKPGLEPCDSVLRPPAADPQGDLYDERDRERQRTVAQDH